MSEVLPRYYIVGILVFTLIIVSGITMIGMFRSVDPTYGDSQKLSEFNSSFAKLDKVVSASSSIQEQISGADTSGPMGYLDSLVLGGWNALKLVRSGFGFFNDIISGLSTFFGVPGFIVTIVTLIVGVLIVFAFISAIFTWPV